MSYGVSAEKRSRTGTVVTAEVTRNEGRLATGDPFQVDRVSLELRQPLFRNAGTLVTTAPLQAATDSWLRAQRAHQIARADLALSVVRQYEEIQRLRRQVELTKLAVERRTLHHRLTRAREATGRTRRLDTLRAELQLGEIEARLEGERDRLASAERTFAELLGAAPGSRYELVTRTRSVYREIGSQDAIETALANRLEYAQALQASEGARRRLKIAERQSLPDLNIYVRLQDFSDALSPVEVATFGTSGISVGLSGGFDAAPQHARIARQRAQRLLDASVESEHIARERISHEVLEALQGYQRTFREAELASRNLILARRRLDLANRLFAIARSDSFSVSEAEAAFFTAESEWLSLDAETMVQTYALAHVLGTLLESPTSLKPPPAYLR